MCLDMSSSEIILCGTETHVGLSPHCSSHNSSFRILIRLNPNYFEVVGVVVVVVVDIVVVVLICSSSI